MLVEPAKVCGRYQPLDASRGMHPRSHGLVCTLRVTLYPEGFTRRGGQVLADRIEFPLHSFPQRVKGQNNFICDSGPRGFPAALFLFAQMCYFYAFYGCRGTSCCLDQFWPTDLCTRNSPSQRASKKLVGHSGISCPFLLLHCRGIPFEKVRLASPFLSETRRLHPFEPSLSL